MKSLKGRLLTAGGATLLFGALVLYHNEKIAEHLRPQPVPGGSGFLGSSLDPDRVTAPAAPLAQQETVPLPAEWREFSAGQSQLGSLPGRQVMEDGLGGQVGVGETGLLSTYYSEIIVCVGFLTAGFVQGVAGFGSGMVSMAILPMAMPLMDVVPIVAVFCAATNAIILFQLRESLDQVVMSALPLLIVGQIGGVPLGVVLLQKADPEWLRILLGITMLCFVAHEMHDRAVHAEEHAAAAAAATGDLSVALMDKPPTASKKRHVATAPGHEEPELSSPVVKAQQQQQHTISVWWGLPFGLLAGVLNGALNEGGPPVVIYFALQRWDKDRVKVALQAFFCSMSTTTVPVQILRGILRTEHLYYNLVGLPAVVMGIGAGTVIYNNFDTKVFGNVVVGALLITVRIAHKQLRRCTPYCVLPVLCCCRRHHCRCFFA